MMEEHNWTRADAEVIKGLSLTPEGKRALLIIVNQLGKLGASSYDDNPYRMAHMEGRRWVAREISRIMLHELEAIVEEPHGRTGIATATERAAEFAAKSLGRTK